MKPTIVLLVITLLSTCACAQPPMRPIAVKPPGTTAAQDLAAVQVEADRARLAWAEAELTIWQNPNVMRVRLALAEAQQKLAAAKQAEAAKAAQQSKAAKKKEAVPSPKN